MDAHEEELKKASRVALNNYNQTLAAEQEENRKEQRRTEERENSAEIWHTMTSDMMTERVEAPEGAVGGGRPPQILSDSEFHQNLIKRLDFYETTLINKNPKKSQA
uniref:RIB43A-like with coiled-coils protein 1 n=1 Tax=Nothobranchius kadleci TaxID=1051664 RepID=A0A1A8C8B0_NOTKA